MSLFTLVAEVSACVLFLGVVIFLSFIRKDYRSVAHIFSGSLFGVTLEYMNVQVMQTYTYSSEFLIQLGSVPDNIPICIGLCWGLIIFACMDVSNRVINIPEWSRTLLDGLLALSIDLSMDTIAIRLDGGFWTWIGIPMETLPTLNSFFGVNYGNFSGWFFVVVIFSFMLRIENRILHEKIQVSPIVSILYFLMIPFLSYIPLFLSFHVLPLPVYVLLAITRISDSNTPVGLMGLLILVYVMILTSILLFVSFLKSKPTLEKGSDLLSPMVFMFFHFSYLSFYLLGGLYVETPLIIILGLLMLVIDGVIHWMILDPEKLSANIKILGKLRQQ